MSGFVLYQVKAKQEKDLKAKSFAPPYVGILTE